MSSAYNQPPPATTQFASAHQAPVGVANVNGTTTAGTGKLRIGQRIKNLFYKCLPFLRRGTTTTTTGANAPVQSPAAPTWSSAHPAGQVAQTGTATTGANAFY